MGWNDKLKIEELKDLETALLSREIMLDNLARIKNEMSNELYQLSMWKETTYNCTPMGGYPNPGRVRQWIVDLIDCMLAANNLQNGEK